MDKENMNTVVKNGKLSKCKNEVGKKKGLSVNTENYAVCMSLAKTTSVDKSKFHVYSDGNDDRSRMRKNVCRKEIRERQINKAVDKAIVSSTEAINSNSCAILRRPRSLSCRQRGSLDVNMNSKLFCNRRSHSENRKPYESEVVQLPAKHLTNDVKKRTLSSIQMWKDKMRKPITGTVPKNITTNSNSKTPTKINVSQLDIPNALKNVILTNEVAVILKDKSYLRISNEIYSKSSPSTLTNTQNNTPSSTVLNSNTLTPSDGFSCLTPIKVRHEKRATSIKESELNEKDINCEILYQCDYLDYVPETERTRDVKAPSLSFRFLRDNINAEQRRLIVGYIIRIGAHNHYSSYVAYQTVKLFNIVIDRIMVDTNDIQLIALACLWITLKQEAPAVKIPTATVTLQLAKDLYINQEERLVMYERKIFSTIGFNIRFADPFSLLSYYILNVNRDSRCTIIKPSDIIQIYFCSSYMIDLTMLDENLCDVRTRVIAIAAVELSLRFVYSSDVNEDQPWCQIWRDKQSLTEWEERMVDITKRSIVKNALQNEFGSKVINKKYMRSKYGRITNFLHDKLKKAVI